jgi:hypothetical protein
MWYFFKIAKIAHFYWSKDPLSFLRHLTVYSFIKYNPDWKVKIYYPVEKYRGENTWNTWEQNQKYRGRDYFKDLLRLPVEKVPVDMRQLGVDNQIPEVFKSDILRWHLLSTEGGLWSDMDILYFRPMDSLYMNNDFHKYLDIIICLIPELKRHSIGFLLGGTDSAFFRLILEQAKAGLNLSGYQSAGSDIMDLYPSIDAIMKAVPGINIGNLTTQVVYPVNGFHHDVGAIFKANISEYLNEHTIGLHWYGGHPDARTFENKVNEANYGCFNNLVSNIIARIMT